MRKFSVLAALALVLSGGMAQAGLIGLGNKGGVPLDTTSLVGTVNLGLNGSNLAFDVDPVFHPNGTITYAGTHRFDDGNKTSFSITANPDPSIVYGLIFGPTPGSGPNSYTFDFSQPFLGGPYGSIHSDFSGSATFADPGLGGSVSNIGVRSDVNGVFVPGVDLLGYSCGSSANSSIMCGVGAADSAIASVSAPGWFSVHFSATLPGSGDIATFNGQTDLYATTTPEPSSLLLLGSGLIGVMVMRRKVTA